MSADTTTDGVAGQRAKSAPQDIGLGYVIYQQVAGVIGAFALIAFFSHFFDIGWRSALADLLGMWDAYVRPAVKWLLDISVVALLRWGFDWHVAIPLIVRDYLSVGLVFVFSFFRAEAAISGESLRSAFRGAVGTHRGLLNDLLGLLDFWLLWPHALWQMIHELFGGWRVTRIKTPMTDAEHRIREMAARHVKLGFLTLSPFFYLALLFAANYLLLRPVN